MGIYFLLLSEILIITSAMYIAISDIRDVIKKRRESPLFQIGQTCGFYALSQAVYECRRSCVSSGAGIGALRREEEKLAVQTEQMIRDSIEAGESCIGEIFDINYIAVLAERYFDDVQALVKPCRDMRDVDRELGNGAVVIFPCVHKGLPHYLLINGAIDDGSVMAVSEGEMRSAGKSEYYNISDRYHNHRFPCLAGREELTGWHNELYAGKYSFFSWADYFKPRVKGLPDRLLNSLVQRRAAPELHKYLLKAERKKNQTGNNHTKINMSGSLVSVSCRERRI